MKSVLSLLALFGVDLRQTVAAVRGLPRYLADLKAFRNRQEETGEDFPISRLYPSLIDFRSDSGTASGHYFHQDLHVAQRIFESAPKRHIDIGSRVDGFVAHVASFREIEVADIRPLETAIPNIRFLQCDLMDDLSVAALGKADSVSCLHALEHFGLGRYGDPVTINGHVRGLMNIASLVEKDGTLYVSVPIGAQRTEFNAHRIFDSVTIPQLLKEEFRLVRFSYIDDLGLMHSDAGFDASDVARNFGCNHGCGIYELRRRR